MGVAAAQTPQFTVLNSYKAAVAARPMSRGFHPQGIYSFSDGLDAPRSAAAVADHTAQQRQREAMRAVHDFQSGDVGGHAMQDDANMLSEMLMINYAAAAQPSASELLAHQMSAAGYRVGGFRSSAEESNWFGAATRHGSTSTSAMPPDSAAAMNFFLTTSSSSPPPAQADPQSALQQHLQPFRSTTAPYAGQGLSLSLSTSLQHHIEMPPPAPSVHLHHQGAVVAGAGQLCSGYSPAAGVSNLLRNSKYARAAQELLQEFCSVERGGASRSHVHSQGASTSAGPSSSSAPAAGKEAAQPLPPAERYELQRKKGKLTAMLDEVERRYSHYCEQMQMVVNFFDAVMGMGAATPYTAQAQKAMSRHFRCLKDAVAAQLKQACEALGEKFDGAGSGLTKGETPRLRLLDQSIRQQRAFHHVGMMDQEAWRPQRGLPERSVNILRAWLFEHFLHPYPSDADKLLLARQTGLSRNQVSNWFINARVRLWKPMIEDMYQQEVNELGGRSSSEPSEPGPLSHDQQQQAAAGNRHVEEAGTGPRMPVHDPTALLGGAGLEPVELLGGVDTPHDHGVYRYTQLGVAATGGPAMRLGAPSGDVSLTLGLRQTGSSSTPRNATGGLPFSFRDFGHS